MAKKQRCEEETKQFVDSEKEAIANILYLTYDCLEGRPKHCGSCAGCLRRKRNFAELGLEDKTEYEGGPDAAYKVYLDRREEVRRKLENE